MTTVIGVSFVRAGKVYWFDPNGLELQDGEPAIVETVRGTDFGFISGKPVEVLDEQIVKPLRKVLRAATEEDLRGAEENKRKEADAFGVAQDKIDRHKLEMKLVDVEYAFDGSRIVFYFTANGRVDFRELVRDLASVFRARIELRQIGVRDEAKMIGGLGPCGRPICCRQFLADFQPVSIKMAKEQNLSLNPTKISGLCGRLMCCLKYEQDHYEAAHKSMPRIGREVETPDGPGTVVEVNVLRERLTVKVQMKDGWEYQHYPFEALEPHKQGEKYVLKRVVPPKAEESDEEYFAGVQREQEGLAPSESEREEGRREERRRPPRPPRPQPNKPERQEADTAAPKPKEREEAKEGETPPASRPRRRGGRRRGGGGNQQPPKPAAE